MKACKPFSTKATSFHLGAEMVQVRYCRRVRRRIAARLHHFKRLDLGTALITDGLDASSRHCRAKSGVVDHHLNGGVHVGS